jgi:UDP-3-O-[3-hydroxymyristoyl] glucosamine N-acyltransferase
MNHSIDENVTIKLNSMIGDNCVLQSGTKINSSILYDNVTIGKK